MPHERTNKSTVTISLGIEEAAELHRLLNAQRALKRKRREAGGVSEDELTDSHDNHLEANDDDDDDDTSWIGVMVKAPPGERGRGTNTEGRRGFKIEDILMHAGITSKQWGRYMSTGHRLINRHFDITKSWSSNTQNNPDGWGLIISEMQEHHPRFLYHDANWLIRHMAISHLSSLNRKFRKLGVDPDISVYQQYLEKKALKPTTQRRTEMRGPMPHGIYKVPVPTLPAWKTTNNSALIPSSNGKFSTAWVPNVCGNTASLQKVSSSHPVGLSIDSESETDCEFSDLYSEEPPNKKRKPCTQPEVPVRQSRRRSQRVPTSLLDAPANTATFKTCHDRLSTESRYEQDEHGDIKNVPSKNNPAAKTMAVKRTRIHLETESRVARSKGKARVLLAESENEGEIPYRRYVNNPSRPHIDSLRRSPCKNCGSNN